MLKKKLFFSLLQVLEEENTKFKEKITILKDKLKEATKIIENLTEQLLASSNEYNRIKGKYN